LIISKKTMSLIIQAIYRFFVSKMAKK